MMAPVTGSGLWPAWMARVSRRIRRFYREPVESSMGARLWLAVLLACGSEPEAGDAPKPGACDEDGVPEGEVAVLVDSLLHDQILGGCAAGPQGLTPFLLYGSEQCELEIDGDHARGCCAGL